MASLLGDVWFYVSGAGFLVSLGLFIFLLGQYRAAVESSEDEPAAEDAPAEAAEPVEPVRVSPREEPQPEPVPVAAPAKASAAPASESTASLSPAVAYLQGIKTQMEHLDKEITNLRAAVAQQGALGDAILKRLAEVAELAAKQPAAAKVEPEQTQSLTIERFEAPKPAPAPAAAPAVSETGTVILPPPSQKPVETPPPAEEPRSARKGPVWPI